MAGTHAILSPSSASRWLHCPASVALNRNLQDESSEFADEGTAAHELAAMALNADSPAMAYLGRIIQVGEREFEVDHEMVENVQTYIDIVRAIPGELLVEQRLPITPITGEPDAFGTSDAVILAGDELVIVDLKYGKGVKVDAQQNEQLAIYALAALVEYEFLAEFKTVRMMIVQPRLGHVSEWAVPVDVLFRSHDNMRPKCERAMQIVNGAAITDADYGPTDKACRWCKVKATCPALGNFVQEQVGADFEDLEVTKTRATLFKEDAEFIKPDVIADKMAAVDLIEDWCKAVRAEVERRLLAGTPVPGYKLVEGRRGARKWANPTEVEATFKSMRMKLEEMYDFTLISPTTAEKLHKAGTIGPRQWPRLQELITQSEGKPSVAPESDKRPALVMTAVENDFADETAEGLV